MKSPMRKPNSFILALLIPVSVLMGCQDDLPKIMRGATPHPGEIMTPPRK